MYKVLIADDEDIIREGLVSAIPWEALDMVLCASAENGAEALEKAEIYKPDLVITDIRMPFMSGLEFVEALQNVNTRCRIVVISGFEEFEYARTAIRLGVSDYLLKPIDLEALGKTLIRIKNEMDEQTLHEQSYLELNRQVRLHEQDRFRHLLVRYIHGSGTFDQVREYLPEMIEKANCVIGVLIRVDNFDRITSSMTEETIFNMTEKVERILTETLRGQLLLELERDRYLCVFAGENPDRIRIQAKSFMIRLRSNLPAPSYSAVISMPRHDSLKCLREVYRETVDYLNETFVTGAGQDIEVRPARERADLSFVSEADLDPLLRAMAVFRKDRIHAELQELEKQLHSMTHNSYLYTSMLMSHLFEELRRYLSGAGFSLSDIYPEPAGVYRVLVSRQTLRGMMEELTQILDAACDFMKENKDDSRGMIKKAKIYMKANFADSALSLDAVAASVGITPTYLSAMFKKQEGQSFVSYLTKIRMEHAEEMLRSGRKKNYEIAEECGYANSTYFSSIFKKYTGYTPSEYRDSLE